MNGQNPQESNNLSMNGSVLGSVNIPNNNTMPGTQPVNNVMGEMAQPTNFNNGYPDGISNSNVMPNLNQQVPINGENQTIPQVNNVEVTPSSEPVAVPIPGTEMNSLTGNTVGVGNMSMMGQDSINNNSFIDQQKTENIGSVPPPMPNDKKKKGMNKTIFAIFIIILIFAVAAGVYYLLNKSSNKVTLTTKEITIGVGEVLSDKIEEYVNVTNGDLKNCSINLRNVNVNTIGEYEYSVTCSDDVYKGKVKVSDVTPPQAELKVAFLTPTSTLKIEDFVLSCTDSSECTTSFANEEEIKAKLSTPGGPYKVAIDAIDKAGNKATYETDLYVTATNINAFTSCSSPNTEMKDYQASKVVTDVFPIGAAEIGGSVSLGIARRDYAYTFTSVDDYKKAIGEKANIITFDGITGMAKYDDANNKLTISTDLSLDTLKSENNGQFSLDYSEIRNNYQNEKGYVCSNNRTYEND